MTMPVARPPPKPTTATVRAASSEPSAPSSGAAAPVSPMAVYTLAEAGAPPELARGRCAEATVGVGERPLVDVERGELLADLLHDRQEDLLPEQARVVEIARPVIGVGAIAVEQRMRARDAGRQRRVPTVGDEHDGSRARSGSLLERGARPGYERVGRHDQRNPGAPGGDRVVRTE